MPRSSVYRSLSNAQEADVAAQHRQIARRTETCRGSNSVVNLVMEDLDEPRHSQIFCGHMSNEDQLRYSVMLSVRNPKKN